MNRRVIAGQADRLARAVPDRAAQDHRACIGSGSTVCGAGAGQPLKSLLVAGPLGGRQSGNQERGRETSSGKESPAQPKPLGGTLRNRGAGRSCAGRPQAAKWGKWMKTKHRSTSCVRTHVDCPRAQTCAPTAGCFVTSGMAQSRALPKLSGTSAEPMSDFNHRGAAKEVTSVIKLPTSVRNAPFCSSGMHLAHTGIRDQSKKLKKFTLSPATASR